jgi:peptidoglycan/xylan/chitin deacetylase (PgdA/CDA1 family)
MHHRSSPATERALRRTVTAVSTSPTFARVTSRRTKHRATIFLLHRMRIDEAGIEGHHDARQLADLLAWLRRTGCEIAPLADVVRRLRGQGPPLLRTVAFTADDGYADQAAMGELFVKHEAPLTIFLSSGFLDRKVMFWWDRLRWVVERLPPGTTVRDPVDIGRMTGPGARRRARRRLERWAKTVHPVERDALIDRLGTMGGRTAPVLPIPGFAPMGWDHARQLAASGLVDFGAHTIHHPILSRIGHDEAYEEITVSRQRVVEELGRVSEVFAYPNGEAGDYGDREVGMLQAAGFSGALAVGDRQASATVDPWRIPRVVLARDLGPARRLVVGAVRRLAP